MTSNLSLDTDLASALPLNLLLELEILPLKKDEEFIDLACARALEAKELERVQNFFKHHFIRPLKVDQLKLKMKLESLEKEALLNSLCAQIQSELKKNANLGKDEQAKSGVSALFDYLIGEALKAKASDIHLEPSQDRALVRFRIDGILHLIFELENEIYNALNSFIKLKANMNLAQKRKAQDGSFSLKIKNLEYDFRLSSLPLFYGESLVIRILEHKEAFLNLKSLNLNPKDLKNLLQKIHETYGLILLTGPTGSGKSTTLYACLNEIKSVHKKIITAEDPIEYKLNLVQQILLNEKAGLDFDNALRAILRQDPDVIMIGEIRDEQSLDIALKASLTGHLVFSTLHTNDALGVIYRMLDMNAKPYLIANALSLIIAQRLVRKLCAHCKFKSSKHYEGLESEFYEARGCEHCKMSGYLGREMVSEFLIIDESLAELIRTGASKGEISIHLKKQNHQSMLGRALEKARQGITSVDEILRVIK